MKRSVKEVCVRLGLLMIGILVTHFGIALFLLSYQGSAPFTTMLQGVSEKLGITVGTLHMLINVVLTVFFFFFIKGYVKIGTVLCALTSGYVIDASTLLLTPIFTPDLAFPLQLCVAAAGCVILAWGLTFIISSDAGTGANDLITVILADKIPNAQFRWCRIGTDVFFAIIGFFTGGILGIGTLFCVFLVGPTAQFFMPSSKKFVAKTLTHFHVETIKS